MKAVVQSRNADNTAFVLTEADATGCVGALWGCTAVTAGAGGVSAREGEVAVANGGALLPGTLFTWRGEFRKSKRPASATTRILERIRTGFFTDGF
jgi:hypothetical protein